MLLKLATDDIVGRLVVHPAPISPCYLAAENMEAKGICLHVSCVTQNSSTSNSTTSTAPLPPA